MKKIIRYFKWLFTSIKSLFIYSKQPITSEDTKAFKQQRYEAQKQSAKELIQPLIDGLSFYHIPDHKIQPVIEYTAQFFAENWRKMTYARMLRKIADRFHLKLKPIIKTK